MKKILLIAIGVLLCASCKHYQRVVEKPVYIHDTTFRYIRDSVKVTDSIFTDRETIIREADSATLAEFGIQLKNNEKAILLLQRELVERIREIEKMRSDSTEHSKETPVPLKETEYIEVEKELNWFQKTLIGAGAIALLALIGFIVIKVRKAIW